MTENTFAHFSARAANSKQYDGPIACSAFAAAGAQTVGIDPSKKLITLARKRFATLDFRHTSFEAFYTAQKFDVITSIMAIEHFEDLDMLFYKIASLLQPTGRVIILSAAYNTSPRSRKGFELEVTYGRDADVAIRINKGQYGVMYNLLRTPESIITAAQKAGCILQSHQPIRANEWPDFDPGADNPRRAILDLFTFSKTP